MESQKSYIIIKGAREHNLQNIEVKIPKGKLVILSGVSGSGKSSLAMDTLYAEGQRRYVESLSSYARQFLGMLKRPEIDTIEGLSPAIAIDQHGLSHNPRSTVGTSTEIYDYFRLLYARIGHPHCPDCGREISRQTSVSITNQIIKLIKEQLNTAGTARFLILSPVVKDRRGEFSKLLEKLERQGFEQARADGRIINLDEEILLIKTNRHNIEAVIDRLSYTAKSFDEQTQKKRIQDSVELALDLAEGILILSQVKDKSFTMPQKPEKMQDTLFSQRFACPVCNISLSEIEPRLFSFNSPHGACPTCEGLGVIMRISPRLVFNKNLTVHEGGILPWFKRFENDTYTSNALEKAAIRHNFSLSEPIGKLSEKAINILLYGDGSGKISPSGFEGVANNLERRYRETNSDYIKEEIEKYMYKETCPDCLGKRLKPEALSVTIVQKSIADISSLSLKDLYLWTKKLSALLESRIEKEIASPIINEINLRLKFLNAVGVQYLNLERTASTLSVGEAQRIRLASQIGSGLTGVLYVLDEPTVGLHQRDTHRLITTLKNLRDLGNTVVVVEHDQEVLNQADWIIDFGPLAGKNGGRVIASGTPEEIKKNPNSLTGQYLSGKKKVRQQNLELTSKNLKFLSITKCSQHNLKTIDVNFPLNAFTCITGISGSGKSTLMHDTLYPALKKKLNPYSKIKPGKHEELSGAESINHVLMIDQSPIGRTSRSNPATYTGVWTEIRQLFAELSESRLRGFNQGYFSFNTKGGRCEACQGQGVIKVEMQFLPDIWVDCEECGSTRYKPDVLEVEYKEKNISQVLDLTIDEAEVFFANFGHITKRLRTLQKIGLGYLQLGQRSPTLSGGESQRLKLARELVKSQRDHTLYLLDEPTTGLHFADVEKLMIVIRELVNKGNTVVTIEHNLDIIKNADWIIDLGPEGGDAGGEIIAKGTIEQIKQNPRSQTAKFLS